MKKFQWQMQAFFIWDALLCILLSLAEVGFYSTSELSTIWNKVAEVYSNHTELVKQKRTLHITIGKATLKAWLANPPNDSSPEPGFVTALRAQHELKVNRKQESINEMEATNRDADGVFVFDDVVDNVDGTNIDLDGGLTLDSSDWGFWDQLWAGNNSLS